MHCHTADEHFCSKLVKYGLDKGTLQDVHDLFVTIAKEAGTVMQKADEEFLLAASTKNNTSDIVTKYDTQVQEMTYDKLRNRYPEFDFLGEETFKPGTVIADKPTFVLDPIDGTLNFFKGVPNYAFSLGLTLEKKPIVGVVFNPSRGDLFTAIKGQGSYWTKTLVPSSEKIRLPVHLPRPMPNLNSCLVAVEWGNERKGANWALRTDVHKKLLTSKDEGGAMCRSVRSNGSSALDFCYVAAGIIDAFWEGGVWSWDVCAGWVILEEAGGIVASANPGDWNPTLEGRLYFAVRKAEEHEQKAVVKELWGIMGDRKFEWTPKVTRAAGTNEMSLSSWFNWDFFGTFFNLYFGRSP